MAKLICETSYDFQIDEAKNDKNMYIVGIFSTAEMENNNKRIYGRDILEREINKVNEKIKQNSLWGELGHPISSDINLDKVAIKIEGLEWKGNNVYGRAKILDTPNGNIAKVLVKEGTLGISSRGLGTVSEDGKVKNDFMLLTYDIVASPSNHGSWVNGIYEGREFSITDNNFKERIVEEDIKKAQEKYYKHLWQVICDIEKNM